LSWAGCGLDPEGVGSGHGLECIVKEKNAASGSPLISRRAGNDHLLPLVSGRRDGVDAGDS